MWSWLLFGPARQGLVPIQGTLRARELTTDTVRDVLQTARVGLPGHDVHLFAFKPSGNRYIEEHELPDLTTEERRGLVIRATQGSQPRDPTGTMIGAPVLQVSLGGGSLVSSAGITEEQARAASAVVDVIEKQGRSLLQPARLQLALPPLVLLIASISWIAAVLERLVPLSVAISGSAVLVLLSALTVSALVRLARELDQRTVAHRFEPVSYRQLREQRASARRDIRVGLPTAILGAAAGAIITRLISG